MGLTDTTRHAAAVQLQVLRALTPLARLELAVDMSVTARALLRARLTQEHPAWAPGAIERELLRHTLPAAALPPSLR
jgi:hypothetical protein